jgi:hypothetical protein
VLLVELDVDVLLVELDVDVLLVELDVDVLLVDGFVLDVPNVDVLVNVMSKTKIIFLVIHQAFTH